MNTLLVIAFIASGVSVLLSLLNFLHHRRSGQPVPGYEVGAMAGSVGVLVLLLGTSKHFNEGIALVLLIVGTLLTTASAVLSFRARRQMRTGGR